MEKSICDFLNYLDIELNYSKLTIRGYENSLKTYQEFLEGKKLDYLKIERSDIMNYLNYQLLEAFINIWLIIVS